ncbi:amidohydrolase family protein [Pelagibius marinus]|uniref:amidohydrolase family protein n=1 Tax=Pelagibius marinus TaxID=2762760 RepID=UPI001D04444F|nr:amidohydrolase family protein [Pelagibius marinus]
MARNAFMRDWDPEGTRLPIKLDSTSNGEFAPVPLDATNRLANRLAQEAAGENARRRGLGRRSFMVSACGAASTLLAHNRANAAAGRTGGFFELEEVAAVDPEAAAEGLEGREFVFDVQGHFVGQHGLGRTGLGDAQQFIKDIFLDSDTDMMVLSFIPSRREKELLTIQEADEARRIIDEMEGTKRLLIHGRANPNQEGDLEGMDELAEKWGVVAWKCYTQWGPDGRGFFLHDEDTGLKMIEKARALGVKNICVHKGLPFGQKSYRHSLASDVGIVARMFPDVNFLIYHSGFIAGQKEGPYDPGRGEGVDELIRSVEENGVARNSNVYAELGSTWRYALRDPEMAAHIIGKLVRHIGEKNVLYGSDCIWYGSPQDQIQALRSFQISEEFQERYGYPKMTPELRARIFGLNATRPYGIDVEEALRRARRDAIERRRSAYRQQPNPHYLTFGPRTRRAFLANLRARGGSPV